MIAFDTNLVVYAGNLDCKEYQLSRAFVQSLAEREDVVVCELMLVEVYLKLRNPKILSHPFSPEQAASYCHAFRSNPRWMVVECAPVMHAIWKLASQPNFAIRRIVDARLALTLRYFGITEFATANQRDFAGFGFTRVWNPLA